MKKKGFILLVLLFLLTPIMLLADINTVLDTIYTKQTAPLKESVWLVLAGSGVIDSDSELSAADSYIKEKKWTAGSSLSTKQLALLLMDNFDLPRGLMYRLTGSPRYALKDLKYFGLIQSSAHADSSVTGYELVNSLNSVLEEDRS